MWFRIQGLKFWLRQVQHLLGSDCTPVILPRVPALLTVVKVLGKCSQNYICRTATDFTYRVIYSYTGNRISSGMSQTISDLKTDQTYTFSFYYRIAVSSAVSPNYPLFLEAILGDEVIFTLPITFYSQRTPTYVLATQAGIRPQSSTAALIIRTRADRPSPIQNIVYVDDVSLAQEEPSTTVVCSPAAPTITITE
jgi:hypothetical protein